ncbi:hypothetical protein CKO15_13815 [Halorhodospira abdelmalekii]|uniref:hypothetical protein n=1 Tax=Halorhodospira abdelmalekii TaxID=421629 RepID=UPI001907303E|nr:hypothetical protein [Halorhodospira abdelmalekii]MBK1736313.1 hypothetical protein [Halorhodospira abdelmalekii]
MLEKLLILAGVTAIAFGYSLLLVDPSMELEEVGRQVLWGMGTVTAGGVATIAGIYIRSYNSRR